MRGVRIGESICSALRALRAPHRRISINALNKRLDGYLKAPPHAADPFDNFKRLVLGRIGEFFDVQRLILQHFLRSFRLGYSEIVELRK